ncbi:MAG: class I SAM-dependent methyltransferase [Nitrospirota bacterium]|jgi:ubiquinone/menaquinone biosynthesis C-methylase UbiE
MDYGDYKAGASSDFFWFKGKRGLIKVLLDKARAQKSCRILNVGAGTGDDLSVIRAFGEVFVVDVLSEALDMIPDGVAAEKKVGDASELDYPDGFFDVVVAFDLLEHVQEDAKAVREIYRVLKPRGKFLFTVPAFDFLFSEHDRRLGHFRRYSKKSLKHLLRDFDSVKMGYWMSTLFFPLAVQRLGLKRHRGISIPRLPKLLDRIFYGLLETENALIRVGLPMPVGSTIYGLCRKAG